MEVLKSKELMLKVVTKLHLYAQVFEKGRYRDISAYSSSPVSIEALKPDSLTPVEKIYFTFDHIAKKIIFGGMQYPLDEWVSTPYGTLRFISQNGNGNEIEGQLYFSLFNPEGVFRDQFKSDR
jgi:hypothetical protein